MLKRDLCKIANVSPTTMAKLGKGESVNVDILLRICAALGCDISDIMEVVPDKLNSAASPHTANNGGFEINNELEFDV